MPYTGQGIVSYGFPLDDFTFTYLAASSITIADVGKAVEIDTSTANKVKLTTDNGKIFGRIVTFEDRDVLGIKVVGVQRRFKEKLPASVGHAIAVGTSVTGGAVAGLVKTATSQDTNHNIVIETGTDYVVVEKL